MMKAHGIYQNNQPIRETTIASTPRKRADNAPGSSHKKRKHDQFNDSNTDTGDDDEGLQKVKPEPVKTEPVKPEPTEATIKEEPLVFDGETLPFSDGALDQGYQADNNAFFNDFLEPGAFVQPGLEVQSGYGGAFGQDVYGGFDTGPTSDVASGHGTSDTILIPD